jgi:hypothetical protein
MYDDGSIVSQLRRMQGISTKYWNITYLVRVPSDEYQEMKKKIEDIVKDSAFFNDTLWQELLKLGVDESLVEYYDFHSFAYNVPPPPPTTTPPPPPPPKKKESWSEASLTGLIFAAWFGLALLSWMAHRKTHSANHWKKISAAQKHLGILHSTRSFRAFCTNKVGVSGVEKDPADIRKEKQAKLREWCKRTYLGVLTWVIRSCILAGWRFEIGVGLWALTVSNGLRGLAWMRDDDTNKRQVEDATIEANLAAAYKVWEVILPITSFMLALYIVLRLVWLLGWACYLHKRRMPQLNYIPSA